ncbi:MAG: MATE family efflux transporter, partial [Muribaculaceae bacterium]|nr:MATE family efflux transporter [Muribaculaceae bacterium]
MTYLAYYKEIIKLGLPILVGQLGMIAVGFADNIMVGNYSTDALASASFVNNVFNIALMLCLGFTYGLTPLIGALYASKRQEDIGATLRRGLKINLIFSLAVTAAMFVLYLNLDRLGQPKELLPMIRTYYLIYLAGVVPVAVFNVFAQWSYALRGTTMPMVIIMIANCINVLGNYMLISGHLGAPELGLTGAGLSTLLARVLCPIAIIAVFAFRRGWEGYRRGFMGRGGVSIEGRRIFRTSLPVGLQMSMETGSFSIACVMAGWLGKIELGAFQILLIVGTLGFCIYYSMGTSVSVMVANAAGKGDHVLMRRIGWAGYM